MLRQLNRFLLFSMGSLLLSLSLSARAEIVSNPPKESGSNVTVEFIYDYQCPYCHEEYPAIHQLAAGGMTVIWRPVAIIHNPESLEEAAGAITASRTGGTFSIYQSLFMANPKIMSENEISENMRSFIEAQPDFEKSMHELRVKAELDANLARLHEVGAEGVPVTIVYPTMHPDERIVLQGVQSTRSLEEAIHAARQMV